MRTTTEIKECVKGINARLAEKPINRTSNTAVKEGYIKSLEILQKHITTYAEANINNLASVQARAIAVLAVDFLNEECTKEILLGVPIKKM